MGRGGKKGFSDWMASGIGQGGFIGGSAVIVGILPVLRGKNVCVCVCVCVSVF